MTDPFSLAANLLVPPSDRDPIRWMEDQISFTPWSKQREVIKSVQDHKRTAVAACHAVGKSHTAAAIACEWLESHQPGTAFVVSTAPSWHQVRAVLWRYINQFHSRYGLRGRVNQTEWFIGGQLVGFGRKPADQDETGMQGIHAQYVLAIIDEADGVVSQLWTAMEAITTGDDCRILAIGNPDSPNGPFREAFESEQWNAIRISAFDNPNFTNEVCPSNVKRNLVTPSWVEDAKKRWGETSPVYQSKVLGLFPDTSEDSVIPYANLVALIKANPPSEENTEETILGVDVAGGGTDMTVVCQRRGNQALKQWTTSLSDSAALTNWLLRVITETQAKVVRIDSTGIGWGIVGQLREKRPELMVVGVNASSKPSRSQFLNARAEMWWRGRELVEKGEINLSQVDNKDDLLAQLSAPKWELVSSSGKIKIESKDDIRTRIGRSPDNADALLLAFYDRWGGGIPDSTPNSVSKISLKDRDSRGNPRDRLIRPSVLTTRKIGQSRWQ